MADGNFRIGLMFHGDRDARDNVNLDAGKLSLAATELRRVGMEPEAVVYNDDFREEVRQQLLQLDAVQVWVNPIEGGRDRSKLDALLREAAEMGVLVQTHPDTILRMGTKEVLLDTKNMGWGSDVHLYRTLEELADALPARLRGGPKVLKQHRGHSGGGIWKVALANPSDSKVGETTPVLLRHAARGSIEEAVTLDNVLARMATYFEGQGRMIEQPYQDRLTDGTVRAYMVVDRVGGFGFQAINALYPATAQDEAPQPGPRIYHPPDKEEFALLRRKMEEEWVDELLACLKMRKDDLPLLWDADFFFGPKDESGRDTYVLCEINVSAVYPYPESANEPMAQALLKRLKNRAT